MSLNKEIEETEAEIARLATKLLQLRASNPGIPVQNYEFQTLSGKTTLLDLFEGKDKLILIHNMGQGCRYCTLWADGFNGLLPHLENACAVALVTKDSPEVQRTFALSRGWHFKMASHGGGAYIQEQSVHPKEANAPGVVCYERKGNEIFRKNASSFGPGDHYSPLWHLLSLTGISGFSDWTPQYAYWRRPAKMDDGGENLL